MSAKHSRNLKYLQSSKSEVWNDIDTQLTGAIHYQVYHSPTPPIASLALPLIFLLFPYSFLQSPPCPRPVVNWLDISEQQSRCDMRYEWRMRMVVVAVLVGVNK